MTEEDINTPPQQVHNPHLIPIAIIVAGLIVAGAVLLRDKSTTSIVATGQELEGEVLPVTKDDHIYGSRNADVFFIEYSDYRCGFCGRFHSTILELLDTYEGRLAWVYRHTPYQPGGLEAAVASECITELAGEDAFWEYTDRAMNNQASLSPEWHLATARDLGVAEDDFNECIASGRYNELIAHHVRNAQELGSQGTPYTVLLTQQGDTIKFSGALPIDRVKLLVERAMRSVE